MNQELASTLPIDRWISETANRPSDVNNSLADMTATVMQERARQLAGTLVEYKELMMRYACAIKEIQTKFEVLNTEFKVRQRRNPISHISSRLKQTASIAAKLSRMSAPFSVENIERYLHDVAGVRVICPYIDDIYTIAEALLKQDDITLITQKDYIANPKPNGYRSLHLIVSVPVFFAEQRREMAVEVQIRTIAMDFWASLEHQLKYKHDVPDEEDIVAQLKSCAEVISETDKTMLLLRQRIENAEDTPTEEDLLLEQLSRLDISI